MQKKIEPKENALVVIQSDHVVAIETFRRCPPLGRFLLRDNGVVCAMGVIVEILDDKPQVKLTKIGKSKNYF